MDLDEAAALADAAPTLFVSRSGVRRHRSQKVGKASAELKLGPLLLRLWSTTAVAYGQAPQIAEQVRVGIGDDVALKPGGMILAATFEVVEISDDVAGLVTTSASVGRAGLLAAAAVPLAPGFVGHPILELFNASSRTLLVKPGLPVAMVSPLPAGPG